MYFHKVIWIKGRVCIVKGSTFKFKKEPFGEFLFVHWIGKYGIIIDESYSSRRRVKGRLEHGVFD